jgi:hypothetical protein
LFIGTNADNTADMLAKGRASVSDMHWTRRMPERINRGPRMPFPGESNHNAKLTEAAVIEIRRRRSAGESLASLAKEYSVSMSLISHVALRRNWKHI